MSKKHEEKAMDVESTLAARSREPGFWRELWQQMRLVFYLIQDPEVPFYLKLLPFAAIIYVIFPFDLITDLVPVIGQLDDITALLVGSKVFIELAPQAVVARHLEHIRHQDKAIPGLNADPGAAPSGDQDLADAIIIDAEHEVVVEKRGRTSDGPML
jgi:uncharacterized membrane protein YkvA (DUF1232 family)